MLAITESKWTASIYWWNKSFLFRICVSRYFLYIRLFFFLSVEYFVVVNVFEMKTPTIIYGRVKILDIIEIFKNAY